MNIDPAVTAHVAQAIAFFRESVTNGALILHHNDADGISSGGVVATAVGRESVPFRRIALEKPYPEALKLILGDMRAGQCAIFVDFGSAVLAQIEAALPVGVRALVIDHHAVIGSAGERVRLLNPVLLGFSGRTDCSAGTVAALFACALNEWNTDTIAAGLAGAFGDGQFSATVEARGLNIPLIEAATALGAFERRGVEWFVRGTDSWYALRDIVQALNSVGSIGYFSGGVDIGVKGIVDGFSESFLKMAATYDQRYRQIVDTWVRAELLHGGSNLDWFNFTPPEPVGVKTVGLLCEEFIARGVSAGMNYICGIQPIPDELPGSGPLMLNQLKVSMRIPPPLWQCVERGERKDLTQILPQAADAVGGWAEACHPHAGAITIPRGTDDRFIEALQRILVSGAQP